MSLVKVTRLRSLILVTAGLVFIAASVVLWFLALSVSGRSAVFPDIDPLSVRLALFAGVGWMLIGLGIGSRYPLKSWASLIMVMAAIGALLGGFMGFLAWFVIHFSLTS